eukprot:TRINITY_DN3421_c0_g3_i2.p1 TRINITY_DN3421_c0_g3~~TRINITY_DN3421_c0_g3_i2.p1  ORF type:complete len:283 (-),score=30.83 TRINITY_DN3421_c0_g3_i2:64-882(-)
MCIRDSLIEDTYQQTQYYINYMRRKGHQKFYECAQNVDLFFQDPQQYLKLQMDKEPEKNPPQKNVEEFALEHLIGKAFESKFYTEDTPFTTSFMKFDTSSKKLVMENALISEPLVRVIGFEDNTSFIKYSFNNGLLSIVDNESMVDFTISGYQALARKDLMSNEVINLKIRKENDDILTVDCERMIDFFEVNGVFYCAFHTKYYNPKIYKKSDKIPDDSFKLQNNIEGQLQFTKKFLDIAENAKPENRKKVCSFKEVSMSDSSNVIKCVSKF